jgi:hypothetical protein
MGNYIIPVTETGAACVGARIPHTSSPVNGRDLVFGSREKDKVVHILHIRSRVSGLFVQFAPVRLLSFVGFVRSARRTGLFY